MDKPEMDKIETFDENIFDLDDIFLATYNRQNENYFKATPINPRTTNRHPIG